MNLGILTAELDISTSWRDYVPLAVLVTLGPLIVCGVRKLWRAIADHKDKPEQPKVVAPRDKEPPPEPEFRVVEIATFMNDFQADSACAMLNSAGIPAFIRRDDCGGMRPWLRFATGGLRLTVRDTDAEHAALLLKKAKG